MHIFQIYPQKALPLHHVVESPADEVRTADEGGREDRDVIEQVGDGDQDQVDNNRKSSRAPEVDVREDSENDDVQKDTEHRDTRHGVRVDHVLETCLAACGHLRQVVIATATATATAVGRPPRQRVRYEIDHV